MKKSKKKIKKLKKKLKALNYQLIITQSVGKTGVWEYNLKKKKLKLSKEIKYILGLNKFINLSLDYLIDNVVSNKDKEIVRDSFQKIKKKIDITFSIIRPSDNKKFHLKIIAKSVFENIKNKGKIIGIIQDISEEKINEELLKQAIDKAEESDTLKSAFLANMSHEIRTPLNAILGFSKLLTLPDITKKRRQEYNDYITNSANNLLSLISDIIDVSKIEAGKIDIEKKDTYINKIINELKVIFDKEKINIKKENIEIRVNKEIFDKEFIITSDPNRLKQILINLIGNALKFVDKGYIEFGYKILNNKYIQFFVKDTGIGIPKGKMELIFSRFGKIIDKKIKNPGGTGLGLSITKNLIEKLGGEIWFESKVDIGTTFLFTIPYRKVEKQSKIIIKPTESEYKIGTLKILAAEDDILNMMLLEDTLKMYSDKIIIDKAKDGFEAIKLANQNNYDLIIMDIRMPIMDGYEATEHIRNNFPYPKNKIPILGLSAHVVKAEVKKGKTIGMTDFLSKPINIKLLLKKVIELTNSKKIENIDSKNNNLINKEKENSILDLSFFINLYKNDKEKIKNTLNTYLHKIPEQLENIEFNYRKNEFKNVRLQSHSLKSTLKYLGRKDLSELAREIEFLAKEKDKKRQIPDKLKLLNDNWLQIEKEINSYISEF